MNGAVLSDVRSILCRPPPTWPGGERPARRRLSSLKASKVRALTIPELEDLAEAVLEFSSRADFEHWLLRHLAPPVVGSR
jgi:hypothetical protein